MINKFKFEELVKRTEMHEGFRARAYQDSLGNWTIGHGIFELTEEESDMIVREKLKKLIPLIENKIAEDGISIDDFRIGILVEMAYQMGFSGLCGFKKMWKALKDIDYQKASDEMLSSKWAKQSNVRARHLAKKMLMGV